jgi:hypothetical protein
MIGVVKVPRRAAAVAIVLVQKVCTLQLPCSSALPVQNNAAAHAVSRTQPNTRSLLHQTAVLSMLAQGSKNE